MTVSTSVQRSGQFQMAMANPIAIVAIIAAALAFFVGRAVAARKPTVTHDTVVEAVQNVSDLVSARANLKDIMTVGDRAFIWHRKAFMVIHGHDLLGIHLDASDPAKIDGRTITISIPHAQLIDAVLDSLQTLDVRQSIFHHYSLSDQDEMVSLAKAQIKQRGADPALLQHADSSAVKMLRDLFSRDGYTVNVQFRS